MWWFFFQNVSKIMIYQFIVFLQLLFLSSFHVTLFYQFKIWISKNDNFNQHFKAVNGFSWKVTNIKVVQLIKIYNFYFGHFFIQQNDYNIVHKIYISLLYFMKPYETYVKFMNNVTITLSDEQITKIKVVDLDELYNLYVHDFFNKNYLLF